MTAAAPPPSHPRTPRRILIVDDHEDSRDLLSELFQVSGFVVRQAHSAGEALVVLRERAVDAVITDYNLGAHTETGCWLLERAHDEGLLDAVFAIIVYSALPYVTPPLSLPRARSFQKPTDIDVLLREIDRLLESAGNRP